MIQPPQYQIPPNLKQMMEMPPQFKQGMELADYPALDIDKLEVAKEIILNAPPSPMLDIKQFDLDKKLVLDPVHMGPAIDMLVPNKDQNIIAGRKLYISTDPRALWISRIASLAILAVGITLIAASVSAVAGVLLILAGLAGLVYSFTVSYFKEMICSIAFQEELLKRLNQKDWNDFPKVKWMKMDSQVNIALSKKTIVEQLGDKDVCLFVGSHDKLGKELKNPPPFVVIAKKQENGIVLAALNFRSQLKKSSFVILVDDAEINLKNHLWYKVPFFSRVLKKPAPPNLP